MRSKDLQKMRGRKRYNKKAVKIGSRKGDVAQSAHRIKDKRLRRACGIPDTACCQCY